MEEIYETEEQKIDLPEPNPVTQAAHKRDYFRKVLLPFILFLLILIGLGVAFILIPVGSVETWSQIATIILIIVGLIIGLIVLAVLGGLVYLVSYILGILPGYTRMAQEGLETIREQSAKGADLTAKPVIQVQSFLAVINAIFGRKQKKREEEI
ncbi:MAG: hypothetical protein PVI99_07680 [Anaerolineales bacterium]|jgi:hypothetical protein